MSDATACSAAPSPHQQSRVRSARIRPSHIRSSLIRGGRLAGLVILALSFAGPSPSAQDFSPADFHEIAGVRQLSSRLIVRPWPRRAVREAGLTFEQTASRVAQAQASVRRHEVLSHVPATGDFILRVPADMTAEQFADSLMVTGLFQYAEPDWILLPDRLPRCFPGAGPCPAASKGLTPRPPPAGSAVAARSPAAPVALPG